MPCYEVNTVSIEISATNREFLKKALTNLGHSYSVLSNGTIQVVLPDGNVMTIYEDHADLPRRSTNHLNEVRLEYSKVTVESRAQQLGYTVIESENESGEAVYTLRRYD